MLKRSLSIGCVAAIWAIWGSAAASAAVVADNGFRPNPNGFSFENYGNDAGYRNLTSSEMQRLFGPGVCANRASATTSEPAPTQETGHSRASRPPKPGSSGSGGAGGSSAPAFTASGGLAADPASCNLTPDAQAWMDTQNREMGGGHCNGFAVLSEELYKNQSPFDPFGPGSTFSYPIQGNSQLQRAIAYAFVYQSLTSVVSKRIHADANTILAKLQEALTPTNSETYTLGIYKPDGSGGHAITPYAIEDLGNGLKAIDVYDNNYPDQPRQVMVNTTANTWSYSGASNPALKQDLYGPGANDPRLEIDPTTPGLGVQPPEFGKPGGNLGAADRGGAASATSRLDTVSLQGNLHYHSHLVIDDGPGHRVGIVAGQIVNTFPGAFVQPVLQGNIDYSETQEPLYLIPSRNVKLTIDGSRLPRRDTETLSVIGDGQDIVVQSLGIGPGQRDVLRLLDGASRFTFTAAGRGSSGSPVLRIGADSTKGDVALRLKVAKMRPGSTVHVKLNEAKQLITFYSTGGSGSQRFVLSAVKETKKAMLLEGSDTISLARGESVAYSYAK